MKENVMYIYILSNDNFNEFGERRYAICISFIFRLWTNICKRIEGLALGKEFLSGTG
jgi:hypothetical protein